MALNPYDTIDKYVEQDLYTQTIDPINGQNSLPWIRDGYTEHYEARVAARALREQQLNVLYPMVAAAASQTTQTPFYVPRVSDVEALPKFASCQTSAYRYEKGTDLWRGADRQAMEDERGTGTLPILAQAQRDWYFEDKDKDKGQVEREQYMYHDHASRVFDRSGTPDFGKPCA